MQGYAKDEKATREIMNARGFLLTGDVGYLDRKGFLYLTGRKKNLIVTSGGKNVYPEEIENRFRLYEEVEQVLVRGYTPSPQSRAEEIEALIYPSEEHFEGSSRAETADRGSVHERIAAIIQEVNTRLKPYQRLSRFRILEKPLETTTTQKIKRYKVVG
jgi:long-chain acyl-CoA synthetase